VFDGRFRRQRPALEQQLASQQGAVEGAWTEHRQTLADGQDHDILAGPLGLEVSGSSVPPETAQTHRHSSPFRRYFTGMPQSRDRSVGRLRVGRAAEMLGVSVETLRRWETEGRLHMARSEGGQRLVDIEAVARLLDERRKAATDRPIVAQSARNRFPGIITRIERDRVAAVVEVIAGPHRLVSLMTAEAVDDLELKVGDEAVCVVKSTNVIVEIPSSKDSRA
jgi:molybdopterin-binding protein